MYKRFLTVKGTLNPNVTRTATSLDLAALRELSGTSTVSLSTAIYCIHNEVECRKCETCSIELEVEDFKSGWKESKRFCSIKCKSTFNHATAVGAILTDYSKVLDKNGNPSDSKLSRLMNASTIKDLQEKTGLITEDVSTLLLAAINPDFQAKYCNECDKVIPIHNFKIGYRENQKFCSNFCKDTNVIYRQMLSSNRVGEKRYDNPIFVDNVISPWFSERVRVLREDYDLNLTSQLSDYIGDKTCLNFECIHCGTCFISNFSNNGRIPRCPRCKTRSKQQVELIKFVESLGYSVSVNDRNVIAPNEIDIFIPKLSIGIEYDGFYWHDDKDDSDKYALAASNGVRIIRVFEDEYRNKKDIVLSRISSILGRTSNRIFARKCEVRELSTAQLDDFMTANHIQGNVYSSVRLGLFDVDELVAAMSFSKSRYDDSQWELTRFSNKKNSSVVGGATKLFAYFKKVYLPESITSYCDLRYGIGGMYEKMGFVNSGRSQANYFYYKNRKRHSRVQFQKHKLSGILKVFDESKSETQNMSDNGYLKIFDNGNLVYKWHK